ncbi:AarF/ABC1/UbiB kinase family protein [Tessaracoccus sp. OS52]|uniref:ABC1 kinase family protein n=1 Tax=Tessaracoccus sp. OS52 TaxID=2886691 RepID=UPI001D10B4B5|nr:AarF/UbiB family protein [Tessaracoccus sp. OS52]MCC2594149.1 AarF/ABC1/UbiB kinase family protein [Tessaracoccus sp. OS52]
MLIALLGTAFNVGVLLVLSRRLLGVPVGWGRTVLVGLMVNSLAIPAATTIFEVVGADVRVPGVEVLLLTLLLGAWALTIQLIVLTVLEAVLPTRSVPSLTTVVTEFPAMLRRVRRYVVLWWIAVRHGLAAYLGPNKARDPDVPRLASSLRKALTRAGVTFIKLGQMLSTRPDVLPAPFIAELSRLQSEVEAEPWSTIEPILRDSLGQPIGEVFSHVEETPLAAASVAQIHTATLLDGTDVVVKVQRPRARAQATADLDIVTRLAERLERQTDWGRRMGTLALAEGFRDSLNEELDYRTELANTRAVGAADGAVRVPDTYPDLSSSRVLVMERLDGQPLSRAGELLQAMPRERRRELADDLFAAVLNQIIVTGVFHADLHPGNIFLTPSGLALLDFGSVGRLDKTSRTSLGMVLLAIDREDAIAATDALIDLLDRPDGLDDRLLERQVGQLILRFGDGVGASGTGEVFAQLIELVLDHGFSIPPQLAAAFRALGALEGSLALLAPEVDLVSMARRHGAGIMSAQATPQAVRTTLENQLATLVPLIQRLPRRISRITEQLEDGTLVVNMRTMGSQHERSYVTGLVQQVSTSLLASAAGIGGVMLLQADGGPTFLPGLGMWPFLGLTFLFIAFVLGTRVLIDIFHGRDR